MAGKRKIGATISLDGQEKFRKDINGATTEIKKLDAESKLLNATYETQQNSLTALQAKQKNLTETLTAQNKKVDAVKAALKGAQDSQKDFNKRMEEAREALESAQKSLDEMVKSGTASEEELKNQQEKVDQLSQTIKNSEKNYQTAEDRITKWKTELAKAETEVQKTSNELEKNSKYLKEAEESTDQCATSIDSMGKQVKQSEKQMDDLSESIEETSEKLEEGADKAGIFGDVLAGNLAADAIGKGLDLVKEGIQAVGEQILDFDSAAQQLQASTGVSTQTMEGYRDVMLDIRGNNFGQDYTDIADAMGIAIQTMVELNDSDLQNVTENAITLRDTFGMDYQETLRSAKMLMDQFGVSSEQAFNLIVQGAQNGLNKNGDLLDTINEYSVHYKQMGASAEDFFNSLENGTKSGTFSVDKLGDAYKEFGIRVKDTATTTDEAYQLLGLDADEMREKFAAGGESARNATDEVLSALFNLNDQVVQNQAGVDLFGTMWEDLGISGIQALTDLSGSMDSTKQSMTELKEMKYDDLATSIGNLGAAVQEKFLKPIADNLLPKVKEGIDKITEMIDPPKEKMQEFMDEVISANDELERSAKNGKEAMDNAELESSKIALLGQKLLTLNSVEDKSLTQKYQLREVVAELGEQIPEIAAAYDSEKDSVNLTNEEITKLIGNTRELMVAQAAQAAGQEIMNALLEAQVQYDYAKEIASAQQDTINGYYDQINALSQLDKELKNGNLSTEEYNEKLQKIADTAGISANDIGTMQQELAQLASNTQLDLDKTNSEMSSLEENMKSSQKQLDNLDASAKTLKESYNELEESAKDMAPSTKEAADAFFEEKTQAQNAVGPLANLTEEGENATQTFRFGVTGAFQSTGKAAKEMGSSLDGAADGTESAADRAAKAAEAGAKAQQSAISSIKQTYDDYRSQIESDLQNKISLFDLFDASDGGEDQSVEQMTENLKSQIDAFKNYQENLEAVKEHVGKEIAPEFMQYIESMGVEGSNILKHILTTFADEEPEKVREMSDAWMEAMDLTDEISKTGAANRIAYDAAMGDLGSSDTEFEALKESMGKAVQIMADSETPISDAARSAFEGAVSKAQEYGVKIPDGLEEGLASGTTSLEEATAALNGAIQGQFESLAEIAKEAGIEGVEGLAEQIYQGGDTAAAAYLELVNLMKQYVPQFGEAGEQGGDEYSSGLEEKSGDAADAGEELSDSAAKSAEENSGKFADAGESAGEQYASGIASQTGAAVSAAGALAQAARSAAASWENSFYSVGVNMAHGVAEGIEAGKAEAINATIKMAKETLKAAEDTLEIHSPSKAFEKRVGKRISEGTAFGIKDNADLPEEEAERMANQVLEAASTWIDGYKTRHKLSLDNEKWYWEKVKQHAKEGTEAYNQIVSKIANMDFSNAFQGSLGSEVSSRISNNFGISRTKTTGSGSKKKTEEKDAESYYSEIYSAAQKYLSNISITNDISLDQQEQYWIAVRKNLADGTQAWYDATRELKNVRDKQKDEEQAYYDSLIKKAEAYVEKRRNNGKMSAQQEMEYWQEVKSTLQKGTSAYEEAKKNIQDAYDDIVSDNEKYVERQKLLNKMTAEQELEHWQNVKASLKKGTDAYYDAVEHIQDAYNNIIDEGEKYVERQKAKNKMSAEEEVEYWKKIQNQVKDAPDAYYEAADKIDEARSRIVSDAQDYVRKMQILNKMDEEQELAYWKELLKQLEKEGGKYTKAWYEIYETIKNLKKQIEEEAAQEAEEAARAQEEEFDALISNAETYVHRKQLFNKMDTSQELEYWIDILHQIADKGGKYTDAWYEVYEKIVNLRKEKREEEEQAAEEAANAEENTYNQMISDANDYIRKRKILGQMTEEQELAYWISVQKGIRQGTDAWYDAQEQINSLRESIRQDAEEAAREAAESTERALEEAKRAAEEAIKTRQSVQNKLLSSYKTYYKMSAKAEMEYWDIARRQFAVGTDERIEADQKYLDAKQEWYDKLRELDENYAEDSKKINEELADNVKDLQDAYKDAVSSRKQDILSSMNLFESWDSTGYDADTLLHNLKTQVSGLAMWEQQLEELGRKNISADLLEELKAMGPDAAASIYSLNQMTAEQLEEYNKLWQQKNTLAESQAVKDNETLRKETNNEIAKLTAEAKKNLNELNKSYQEELKELNTGLSSELANLVSNAGNIGEDAVSGLIAGIRRQADSVDTYNGTAQVVSSLTAQLSALEREGEIIGKNALDGLLAALTDQQKIDEAAQKTIDSIKRAMEEAAEIHSPSRLFKKDIGQQISAGVGEGMEEGTEGTIRTAQDLMRDTLVAAQMEMLRQQEELREQFASLDFAGIARLNRMTEQYQVQTPVVNVDNSGLASLLNALISKTEALSEKMDHMQVVMDTGALVGAIQPEMSRENATVTTRRTRGGRR